MAAPKGFQQDTISKGIDLAQRLIDLQDDITQWSESYTNNDIVSLSANDIQLIAAFEHLNANKVAAGKTALETVAGAISTNRAALKKMTR